MLVHIHCQPDLSGKLQPFCLQHTNGVCVHRESGAFRTCQTCCTSADRLNAAHRWSPCSPDSSDLMPSCAREQKHVQFCAETWKRSLALLGQERVIENKQREEVQSCTRSGRKNKNLTLGSVLSTRGARASEERINIPEFCLWTKAWTVIKPGYIGYKEEF